jgi:hypothetical protein
MWATFVITVLRQATERESAFDVSPARRLVPLVLGYDAQQEARRRRVGLQVRPYLAITTSSRTPFRIQGSLQPPFVRRSPALREPTPTGTRCLGLSFGKRKHRLLEYGSHSGRMVRTDSALLDPRHILAAADADGAAFDPDGARVTETTGGGVFKVRQRFSGTR